MACGLGQETILVCKSWNLVLYFHFSKRILNSTAVCVTSEVPGATFLTYFPVPIHCFGTMCQTCIICTLVICTATGIKVLGQLAKSYTAERLEKAVSAK